MKFLIYFTLVGAAYAQSTLVADLLAQINLAYANVTILKAEFDIFHQCWRYYQYPAAPRTFRRHPE